jgi:hypothetical protein
VIEPALARSCTPACSALRGALPRERRASSGSRSTRASDETCTFLATLPHSRVVEILAQNQVRLLRCSSLVEALGENPLTGMATIDRILHFLGVERGEMEEPEPEPNVEPVPTPPPPDPSTATAPPVDLDDQRVERTDREAGSSPRRAAAQPEPAGARRRRCRSSRR